MLVGMTLTAISVLLLASQPAAEHVVVGKTTPLYLTETGNEQVVPESRGAGWLRWRVVGATGERFAGG